MGLFTCLVRVEETLQDVAVGEQDPQDHLGHKEATCHHEWPKPSPTVPLGPRWPGSPTQARRCWGRQRASHHLATAIPGLLPALLDTGGWSSIAVRVCENTSSVSVVRPGALVITMAAQAWREAQVPQPGARGRGLRSLQEPCSESPYLRVALQLLPHLSLPESLGH